MILADVCVSHGFQPPLVEPHTGLNHSWAITEKDKYKCNKYVHYLPFSMSWCLFHTSLALLSYIWIDVNLREDRRLHTSFNLRMYK